MYSKTLVKANRVDKWYRVSLIYVCKIHDSVIAVGHGRPLRSAIAGRLYKHQSKHTSNSGFDQTFMPCSGYILIAAEQRVGYQISWVDLQREVNCP